MARGINKWAKHLSSLSVTLPRSQVGEQLWAPRSGQAQVYSPLWEQQDQYFPYLLGATGAKPSLGAQPSFHQTVQAWQGCPRPMGHLSPGLCPKSGLGKPFCPQRAGEDVFSPAADSSPLVPARGKATPCREIVRTPPTSPEMATPRLLLRLLVCSTKWFSPLAFIFVFEFVLGNISNRDQYSELTLS